MKKSRLMGAACACVLTLSSLTANAVVVSTFNHFARGGYFEYNGSFLPTEPNFAGDIYSAGVYWIGGNNFPHFRNYFMFDLAGGFQETITSATLRIFNPAAGLNSTGYTPVNFELHQVGTSPSTILSGISGATGQSIYSDLGDGAIYSSVTAGVSSQNGYIDLVLNTAAIADLQSAAGVFTFGGRVVEEGEGGGVARSLFRATNDSTAVTQLIVETLEPVPVPGAVWLFSSGLLGLVGTARSKKT